MIVATICVWPLLAAALQESNNGEPASLFPAEDPLRHWVVRRWDDVSEPAESRWELKDDVLHGGEPRGSWLLSEQEYGDFALEFEFKLGPLGNSGVALRAPLDGDPAFDGIELQMAELKYNLDAKPSELTGGLYRAVAPTKQVYVSGEWNRYEVTLQGRTAASASQWRVDSGP